MRLTGVVSGVLLWLLQGVFVLGLGFNGCGRFVGMHLVCGGRASFVTFRVFLRCVRGFPS